MIKAEVYVSLKETLSDPEGLTIKHALESLGYKGLEGVRIGKLIKIELDYNDKDRANREIKEMCDNLLANPVIEDYNFKISEE